MLDTNSLGNGGTLLTALLQEQQQTAVERFARWHQTSIERTTAYRELIPLTKPQPGQQYAFEVDLDACSGCKACVTACHNLNGLEDNESWRGVGLLHGGASQLPVVQHVTTACHHCLEPACLNGCPVDAYEKDPLTGIVRHLDDQCIGCQYCMLTCPYDVPKYSHRLGIVRKCDMCSTRLAANEAPACVQSCPNAAIRIALVERQEILESAEAHTFLPGAPDPGGTLPTTIYKTARPLPRNLLPADYYSASPQHAHLPLVLMLVLTQMSVGAFAVDLAFAGQGTAHRVAALLLGLLGLAASILHLGRPLHAYRAILGWRRSWLSREILAFSGFAALAIFYAATAQLGLAVAIAGAVAVFCSAMIYASTGRPFWNAPTTLIKFALTCAILGLPLALLIQLASAGLPAERATLMCAVLAVAALLKLLLECSIFLRLRTRQHTPLKRTALLMVGDLGLTTFKRFFIGIIGGVLLPSLLYTAFASLSPLFVFLVVGLVLVLCLIGELLERYLFFTAVVAPKMPGVM